MSTPPGFSGKSSTKPARTWLEDTHLFFVQSHVYEPARDVNLNIKNVEIYACNNVIFMNIPNQKNSCFFLMESNMVETSPLNFDFLTNTG